MTANGNGSIGGGAIQFQLKRQNTDLTVDLNFKGRQTMNDQPEILKMTFDNDMVLSQPEIKYEIINMKSYFTSNRMPTFQNYN